MMLRICLVVSIACVVWDGAAHWLNIPRYQPAIALERIFNDN